MTETVEERRDALVERLFADSLSAFELVNVYLGHRLGLYTVLRDHGPLAPADLARRAGIADRYGREWLEQQAAAGILELRDDDGRSVFALPPGHTEPLTDEGSLNFVAPFAQLLVACVRPIDDLVDAFRTGVGVPYAAYGSDLHDGQGAFTRPIFLELLGKEWLPAVTEIHERLQAEPAARVVDVACGVGWSSIAMAKAYPAIHVDGIDLDEASIAKARANLAGSGVHDRVVFHHRDAGDPALRGRYDLVTIFEALHDMSYPVEVLRACRALLVDGGTVIIGDERVEDAFSVPVGPIERLYYAVSGLGGMVRRNAPHRGRRMRKSPIGRSQQTSGSTPLTSRRWSR